MESRPGWRFRFPLRTLMVVVAVVAVDCALLPVAERLAGVLLIGLALQIGLFRIVRASGRERRFWLGFEVTGLAVVLAYSVALLSASNRAILQWPFALFAGLLRVASSLPEDPQLWLLRHVLLDLNQALRVIDVIAVFEISYGLPMMLLAIAGGLAASRFDSHPGPAGAMASRVQATRGHASS